MKNPLDTAEETPSLPGNLPRETCAVIWEAGFACCVVWREHQKANGPMCETPAPPNPFRGAQRIPHDFDDLAVAQMSMAQMNRLAQKREEGMHGWDDKKTPIEVLRIALERAVKQGKWIDVANYATFLYAREHMP